jgi:hypothetical protein
MNSCPHCGLVDQARGLRVIANEGMTTTRMIGSAEKSSSCTCATNLKHSHGDGTGLERIEDCTSLNTLDLGQGVVMPKNRDKKSPRCAGCHEGSKHRLGLTIDHTLVAVVWLCDRHKRLAEYGSWSFQIEPNYGVPWHEI